MSVIASPQKSTPVFHGQLVAEAFAQSVRQAFGPINAALKALKSIKVHELSDAERHKIERTRSELEAFAKRLRKIYIDAADRLDWADYIAEHVLSLKDEFDIKTNKQTWARRRMAARFFTRSHTNGPRDREDEIAGFERNKGRAGANFARDHRW